MTPRQQVMYDLLWIVDGKVKEVLEMNKPQEICKAKASRLKSSTHKIGLLQPRKTLDRPKTGWV